MSGTEALSEDVLAEIVGRVVAVAQPERIILFGSAARGSMTEHSDVDLLVIKSGDYNPGRVTEEIYRNLRGARRAVDVVVVTPEQVERYRDVHCLVIAPALAEGREVYRVPASAAR